MSEELTNSLAEYICNVSNFSISVLFSISKYSIFQFITEERNAVSKFTKERVDSTSVTFPLKVPV